MHVRAGGRAHTLAMLKEFDKNGDGKLDTGEVADLVEALVHERSINEVNRNELMECSFINVK